MGGNLTNAVIQSDLSFPLSHLFLLVFSPFVRGLKDQSRLAKLSLFPDSNCLGPHYSWQIIWASSPATLFVGLLWESIVCNSCVYSFLLWMRQINCPGAWLVILYCKLQPILSYNIKHKLRHLLSISKERNGRCNTSRHKLPLLVWRECKSACLEWETGVFLERRDTD